MTFARSATGRGPLSAVIFATWCTILHVWVAWKAWLILSGSGFALNALLQRLALYCRAPRPWRWMLLWTPPRQPAVPHVIAAHPSREMKSSLAAGQCELARVLLGLIH